MTQFKIVMLLIATSALLGACVEERYPNGHKYITITNKSDIDIGFQVWMGNQTFFCDPSRPGGYPYVFVVRIDSSYNHYITDNHRLVSWEVFLDKGQIITIPIVNQEVFYQYWTQSCDTIRKYVPILHRYELKLEDLERMNWTVVYPPIE